MPFFKQYDSQFTSSINDESPPFKRCVFNDLCSLADRDGFVRMGYDAIAAITKWPTDVIIEQMTQLQKPDPRSRSAKCGGARIVQEGVNVWRIVNYAEFRKRRDTEVRKTQNRENQRAKRLRDRARKAGLNGSVSHVVSHDDRSSHVITGHHMSSQGGPDARRVSATVSQSQPNAEANIVPPLIPPSGGEGAVSTNADTEADKPSPTLGPLEWQRKKSPDRDDGWTVELKAAFRAEFPDADMPARFRDVPTDYQRQIRQRAKKTKGVVTS